MGLDSGGRLCRGRERASGNESAGDGERLECKISVVGFCFLFHFLSKSSADSICLLRRMILGKKRNFFFFFGKKQNMGLYGLGFK